MRHLRICLLLLLAVLIPVRGAMAAAMLCMPPGSGHGKIVVVERLGGGAMAGAHDHAHHPQGQHAQGQHAHEVPAHAGGELAGPDQDPTAYSLDDCSFCATSCSLTPLASTAPGVPHSPAQASLNPAPPHLAPSFISDGEERPPRTI